MNISLGAKTDIGTRSHNEDCIAILEKDEEPLRADAILVIADGMGGRSNGEEASNVAVELVRDTIADLLDPASDQPLPPTEDILAAGMRRANSKVFDLSQRDKDKPGMGTTCIASIVDNDRLTFAHVGDSRAYLIRDGEIKPLTTDHTYVAEQVRLGNLTVESAKKSRFRNVITRAIGVAPTVQPDFYKLQLEDDDCVLFCTDGLTNTINDKEILDVIEKSETAQSCANNLVEAAKTAGAHDNISVITVFSSEEAPTVKNKHAAVPPMRNGNKPLETASNKALNTQVSSKPEKPKALPATDIEELKEPKSGISTGLVAAVSAFAGAAIVAAVLYGIGWRPARHAQATTPAPVVSAVTPPSAAVLTAASYSAPAVVYAGPVKSSFLLYSSGGVFVAKQSTGTIVKVSSSGQVIGPQAGAPPSTNLTTSAGSAAVDEASDLYFSSPASGTLTQISSVNGSIRVLASGLTKPGAVAVSDDGDVYFIQNGQVEVIHPKFPAGKP